MHSITTTTRKTWLSGGNGLHVRAIRLAADFPVSINYKRQAIDSKERVCQEHAIQCTEIINLPNVVVIRPWQTVPDLFPATETNVIILHTDKKKKKTHVCLVTAILYQYRKLSKAIFHTAAINRKITPKNIMPPSNLTEVINGLAKFEYCGCAGPIRSLSPCCLCYPVKNTFG